MVSVKDVAERAGVSMMTVSRVINNPSAVNVSTRMRVQKIADELNYVPSKLAQGLATNTSKLIGVLFSNIFNPAYLSIILGIEQAAKEQNYNISINNATEYSSTVRGLDVLISQRIDGLIMLPFEPDGINDSVDFKAAISDMWRFYDHLAKTLERTKIPCVVIDVPVTPTKYINRVCHDFEKAAVIGMQYLLSTSNKKIYFLTSFIKDGLWKTRTNVYESQMRNAGLEKEIHINYCANTSQSAYEAVSHILDSEQLPDAFYCANDIIAIGTIQAIAARGLKIPRQISVMGNDGIFIGEMTVPRLSSVDISSMEVGKKSQEVLFDMITHKPVPSCQFATPKLILRQSVKGVENL